MNRFAKHIVTRLIAVMMAAMLAFPAAVFALDEIDNGETPVTIQNEEGEQVVDPSAGQSGTETENGTEGAEGEAITGQPEETDTDQAPVETPVEETEETPEDPPEEIPEEPEEPDLPPVINRVTLKSKTIKNSSQLKASGKAINLRSLIGEKDTGYSVVQGSCTDGTYAYYMMVSSKNQKGRLLKVRMKDNKVVAKSKVVDVNHGNGICYDSKRNRIVSTTYHDHRKKLAFFDAGSLAFQGFDNVRFTYYKDAGDDSIGEADRKKGLTAIAYNATYDCYIAMETTYHDIIIYDAETLQAIGKACTTVNAKYPGVWQSMDADDRYVYYVLSPYSSAQPNNVILCLEWHSENLEPVRREESKFIEKAWKCGSGSDDKKRNGQPSAVIKLTTPYEAESVYHVMDEKTGKAHFYLSEYHSAPKYGWVKKKVKYKKKVRVRKKVKWKKVNGKWKYKKKKVWKYKTKYKKVKRWQKVGLYRYGHAYDLGVF